ncbi:hypothetical protein BC830DRAFT_203487 [Chytriomyces sp. MP71]|nr:hypothetical protein BC830DRAFT_203487 [Chytriomyces sp. MP71]
MMEPPKSPSLVKSRSKASVFQASVVHLAGDVEDLERQQRVLNKRVERITFHLDCFVRIKVILDRPEGVSFHVIADRRNSIEYLMRQVEAEYTHRYAFPLTSDGEEPEAPIEV